FSSRRQHTRWPRDWSSDVCSSDLLGLDMNLIKRVKITETKEFEFRLDALSVLNHPNFGNPNLNINAATFGRITTATGNRTFVFRSEERRVGKERRARLVCTHSTD